MNHKITMELATQLRPGLNFLSSQLKTKPLYWFLRGVIKIKRKLRPKEEMDQMQSIAYGVIKNICSDSETELHTFLPSSSNHRYSAYVLIRQGVTVRIFSDGRVRIISQDEFCDTGFPEEISKNILEMVIKKMDSKRRIMDKKMDSLIQKRFSHLIETKKS